MWFILKKKLPGEYNFSVCTHCDRLLVLNCRMFVCLSVRPSVTLCIVALWVGVVGWKLYRRVPSMTLPIHLFIHFCCIMYCCSAISHREKPNRRNFRVWNSHRQSGPGIFGVRFYRLRLYRTSYTVRSAFLATSMLLGNPFWCRYSQNSWSDFAENSNSHSFLIFHPSSKFGVNWPSFRGDIPGTRKCISKWLQCRRIVYGLPGDNYIPARDSSHFPRTCSSIQRRDGQPRAPTETNEQDQIDEGAIVSFAGSFCFTRSLNFIYSPRPD